MKQNFFTWILAVSVALSSFSLADGTATLSTIEQQKECLREFWKLSAAGNNLEQTRKVAIMMKELGMVLPTEAKAVLINMDHGKAGFIIEVGTAQEVANFIDHAGQRSNTILNSATNNGKKMSNKRYGRSKTGFVSSERLDAILDVESKELREVYIDDPEIDPDFPPTQTKFFVLGDTVATRPQGDGHAWMGIRFQTEPKGPWSTVRLHVRLLDKEVDTQSKTLGVLGNNLIYAAFNQTHSIEGFFRGLLENLTEEGQGLLEIDGMHFDGPEFSNWTDDLAAASLLQTRMAQTILLTPEGKFMPASSYFYGKNVLIHELSPDLSNFIDSTAWSQATGAFANATGTNATDFVHVNCLDLSTLAKNGQVDAVQTMNLVHQLRAANEPVILSKFQKGHSLAQWNKLFRVKNIGVLKEKSKTEQEKGTLNLDLSPVYNLEYIPAPPPPPPAPPAPSTAQTAPQPH